MQRDWQRIISIWTRIDQSANTIREMDHQGNLNPGYSSVCLFGRLVYFQNQPFALMTFCSCFNPLNPHDALKHHFTSLKTDLIVLQLWALEWKFPWNWFTNTWQFSSIFKSDQVIFIHYKSIIATALVVDEDDNGKFRPERVKMKWTFYRRWYTFRIHVSFRSQFVQNTHFT